MARGSTWPLLLLASLFVGPLVAGRRVVDSELGVDSSARSLKSSFRKPAPQAVIAKSPDEHRVAALPGLKDGDFPTKQYAGHIPVLDGFFFYWMFESASSSPQSEPLVIWLNGGPGCSSMDGLWLENGPFRLSSDQQIHVNKYSWHNVANVVYVDQPVGTGLSFTTKGNYADNDLQIDEQFHRFMEGFLELHSQFKVEGNKSRPVFFTGESHAGHYIPSMVAYVLERNEAAIAAGKGELVIDVQGMMIGNGWFDPVSQYDVSDYAFGMGLIDSGQRRALKKKEETCLASIKAGNYNDHVCMALMDTVVAASNGKANGVPKVSMYDVREYELGRQYPPGHAIVEAYLNRDDVRAAIHAVSCPIRFQECTDPPFMHLAKWDGLGVTDELRTILNSGVRSLFFNGQYDLICNHVGNQKALERLGGWKGVEEWESSRRGVWLSDGKGHDDGGHRRPIGYAKEKAGVPLTFLLVLNSGHMVPLDQPRAALDMLRRFVRDQPFSDGEQTTIGVGSCSGKDALDCSDEAPLACASPAIPAAGLAAPATPEVVGTPLVGPDFAVVDFVRGSVAGGDADSNDGEAAGVAVFFEVRSSPDGVVGLGASPPVRVDGLTPGRTYTFSVTAVHTAAAAAVGVGGVTGTAGQGAGGDAENGGGVARSNPSVGSPAVTPGCGKEASDLVQRDCSGHGACREGGPAGVCVCENGYAGDKCEMMLAGGIRGGGGGALVSPGTAVLAPAVERVGDIKVLLEEDVPMLNRSVKETRDGCHMGLQFLLLAGVFRDPEFVLAIRNRTLPRVIRLTHLLAGPDDPPGSPILWVQPRLLPPDGFSEKGEAASSPSSSHPPFTASSKALDEQRSAFSALLRADVGQALGVSMEAIAVDGVAPAGEKVVDWESWRRWGEEALNVSVVVQSNKPEDTGRRMLSAWNDPSSRLHTGMITGLIDFSQGAEVTVESDAAFPPGKRAKEFKGPTLLATLLYIACFALAVPACGMSRRYYSRRKRSGSSDDSSVGSAGSLTSGGTTKRRGWRIPVGVDGRGVGGKGGAVEGGELQEMVPLTEADEGDWSRRERTRM